MSLPDAARWSRLSPLLDELLDLPPSARALRLAELRRASPELADELAHLLTGDGLALAEHFLTGAAPTPGETTGAGPGAQPEAGLAGQRLGAYVLDAPLGQGGGGSVWRARREDGRFDGDVAIKLLHLSLVGRTGAARFKREGQILARLTHPHIARLLDAGVTAGGQPYLVLELVQGQRIDRHCDQRRLGIAARLALFDDVLHAVAHAHTHGVIHRDLKPGNILVTDEGQVKLLDFGIAKLLADEADTADATALTHEGGRALTPDYAAPEQVRGDGVTTATDVYALGVLLYQLLTGRH
ncbi:MAG: serine/threonine protein kinase, partial [Burkholderiales bacterium PBB5]